MKKALLLFWILSFCSLLSFGQSRVMKGKVTDEGGIGLPGVTIFEKGTQVGSTSNEDGNYQISVSGDDAILVFSYVGMIPQELSVAGKSILNVMLLQSTMGIDEVIAIGFGSQKKENVTGATSSVKMDKIIGDRPLVNSAEALQGISAGLQVISTSGQPGRTGTSLNIRGFESING